MLELIKRVEVKKSCNQQQQRRKKARKVVRRSSISSTTTTFESVELGDQRPWSPVDVDNDAVNQAFCSTTLNIGQQAYGSMTYNQMIINAEKSSSTTTSGCFPFRPFPRFNENGVNHSVEPYSYCYPTNIASMCENDDTFMVELSQILGIETRPRLVDLDSILSWNEVPDDLMDL